MEHLLLHLFLFICKCARDLAQSSDYACHALNERKHDRQANDGIYRSHPPGRALQILSSRLPVIPVPRGRALYLVQHH